MTDEYFMNLWFARATQPQLVVYNQSMKDAHPYINSPRWERMRQAASNELHVSTSHARALYTIAMNELSTLGEISEATNLSLTQFEHGQAVERQQMLEGV